MPDFDLFLAPLIQGNTLTTGVLSQGAGVYEYG